MRFTIAHCLTTIILLALPLVAEEPLPRQKRTDRSPRADAEKAGRGMRLARILTDEQREQVRQTMLEQRAELRDLDERILRLQREVEQEVFAGQLNEAALRQKAQTLAQAEAERTLFRARVIARIRPTLTDDQIAQLKRVWAARPPAGRPGRMPQPTGSTGPQREGQDLPSPQRATPPGNP